jgi:para-nitrobenzyl esterase
MINRRQFVKTSLLTSAGIWTVGHGGFAMSDSLIKSYSTVATSNGKIRGTIEEGVHVFKGVPFAGKVSGERRFRRPAPVEKWIGVKDTISLGSPAWQIPVQVYGINEPDPNEDCLVLNIWTPALDQKKRAVMFYNHGGGFSHGSGGSVAQDGANLARFFDVVVVQTNHRLGLMGYLFLDEIAGEEYQGSGNMGMLDIVEGLKWVNENIGNFGGDPDNVMICGESGGGAKTSCLYAMPEAAPYFNKASIESGPGVSMTERENASETTSLLLKELGISKSNWRKLLEVPIGDLMSAQAKLPELAPKKGAIKTIGIGPASIGSFSPVVDGYILPQHPFKNQSPEISRNKPLMVGWNEDEFTFFGWISNDVEAFSLDKNGLKKRLDSQFGTDAETIYDTYLKTRPNATPTEIYVEISSITFMGLGSIYIAEQKVKEGIAPAYLYNFGYKSEAKIPGIDYELGTPHAMDITFKFNNEVPAGGDEKGWSMSGNREERYQASKNFAGLWSSFAKSGIPAVEGQPEWPAYSMESSPTYRIDTQCEVIHSRNKEELDMWRSIGYL